MKRLKQIISALLCAVMVFGTSVIANAQDNINFDNIVVNPAYENILDEEDISEMLEGAEGQSNENQNALSYSASTRSEAIYTTVNSAAEYVRDRMVERQSNIVFSYKTTTGPSGVNDLYKSIVTAATSEELSVGFADGDYLKWSWGGYRGEIQYTFSSGEYTYTFSSDFVYYTTAEQEKQATAVFQSVFNELNLSTKTDYNKICEIYNYVCKTCDYYEDETDSGNKSQFTSYGAIVNHTAVCQGYATAIYRLCKMAGVKSRVITSTNHAWNIVKLGDYYYNVDATWDDSSKYSYDKSKVTDGVLWGNFIYHTYFLKSDNDFSGHIKEAEYTTEVFKKEYPISPVSYYLYEHNAGTQTHTVYCPVCKEIINSSEACTIANGKCVYCSVSKVAGLATTARGANGVNLTISWNAVDGATGYNVYGYNKPADSWTLLDTVTTNKYISPTTPGYEYSFRVAAVNGDVEGTPSDALHTCAACETMDAPSVIASNDKTIQVDWNLVGSHGYVVMWSKDASFKTCVSSKYITGHSKSNYTISVPSGAGQYYVRVRAWRNWETGYVYGSWSEGVKAGQTIAKVTGLKTSARGANGVNLTISWNAQTAADSYNVYGYNKANDSWTLLDTVSTNKYISPTTPGYEYIFRVAAVEDGREGVPSERLHTCAACDTMKAPTVQKSGSQIKVGWELVGSHGYVVMWSTDPTFKTGVSSKYITGHSVNHYTITGINSNQTYYVRVRAWRNWETGYVYGSWSENAEA